MGQGKVGHLKALAMGVRATIGLVSFPGRSSKTNFCLPYAAKRGCEAEETMGFLVSAVEY